MLPPSLNKRKKTQIPQIINLAAFSYKSTVLSNADTLVTGLDFQHLLDITTNYKIRFPLCKNFTLNLNKNF